MYLLSPGWDVVFVVDCVICDGLNNIGIEGGPDDGGGIEGGPEDGGGISVGSRWNNRNNITNHRSHCDILNKSNIDKWNMELKQ